MSELINLATFRARKAAANLPPPDRHVARIIYNFDFDIAFDDLAAMLGTLEEVGRGDIVTDIHERAVVVMP